MPLIDKTGFITDSWVRVGEEAQVSTLSPCGRGCLEEAGEGSEKSIIVPLARLEELLIYPSPDPLDHARTQGEREAATSSRNDSPLPLRERVPEGGERGKLGIHIPNTTLPSSLTPHFMHLTLISIDFPSFADGRGFSIARAIRNAGFAGELRAYGPLIADQYAYALSCGFDTIEIPDDLAARQPEAQWKAAFASMSSSYQRSYVHGANILDQRRVSQQPSPLPLREKVARSDG
jgi:uncharacterized protein (DUF934 family)